MRAIFNLIIGMLCLGATMIDYLIMGINWNTPIVSFFAGANIVYFIADRLLVSEVKRNG